MSKEKFDDLSKELLRAMISYDQGLPDMPDAMYDAKYKQLEELAAEHPEYRYAGDALSRVGSTVEKEKRRRVVPMYSIKNVYTQDDLAEWLADTQYILEYKLDGAAVEIYYQVFDGIAHFAGATTRGDGEVGDIIQLPCSCFHNLPETFVPAPELSNEVSFTFRGEVLIPLTWFANFNKQGKYANARNLASGTLHLKNAEEAEKRGLHFYTYQMLRSHLFYATQGEMYQCLHTMGMPVNPCYQAGVPKNAVAKTLKEFDKRRQDDPHYGTDGTVVKVDAFQLQEQMGVQGKYPLWSVAAKFMSKEAITVLKKVQSQVGRTGAVTPVAVFKPTLLAGSTITNASLHNYDLIQELGIRLGDEIVITKAGEIIPQVVRVHHALGTEDIKPPTRCPCCGSTLRKESKILRCTDSYCFERVVQSIDYFASKGALDIQGLGDATVRQAVEAGLLVEFSDIYTLTKDALLALPGYGETSALNLLDAISESKKKPFSKLLIGVGIDGLGSVLATELADRIGSLDKFLELGKEGVCLVAAGIHGVGDVTIEGIRKFMTPMNIRMLKALRKMDVACNAAQRLSSKLEGRSFCITGTLKQPRDIVVRMIKSHGGVFDSSVKKSTQCLVVGFDAGATKLAAAKKAQKQILTEDQFWGLLA